MERRIVNPWNWADEWGFVQAVQVSAPGRTLICSGQASQAPDGAPLHAGDMAAQTAQALDNLEAVLREAGLALADVVRINIQSLE